MSAVGNDYQVLTHHDKDEMETMRRIFAVTICALNVQKDYGVRVARIFVGHWTYALLFGRHDNKPMGDEERQAVLDQFLDQIAGDKVTSMFTHGGDRRRRVRPGRTNRHG